MTSIPLFRFSQISYATSNIDEAARRLSAIYGIDRFLITRDAEVESPEGSLRLHSGQAFVNGRHIEVIQPAGGADGVYRDMLTKDGFSLCVHHYGHLTRDPGEWAQIQAFIGEKGWRIALGGNFADMMHYVYVDTRADLGHYLEFMYQTELGKTMFVEVPSYV
jgi:hypothetical protein